MTAELYLPGSTILHRLDHRARLLALVALVVVFLLPAEPLALLACAAALAVLLAAVLGVPEVGRPLRTIAPVLIAIVILTPPFTRGGTTLVAVLGFPLVTTGGVRAVMLFLARFTGVTLAFYALLRTLRIEELVQALRWFGLPYRAALVMTITFRYIPFTASVWQNVRDAHRLRAAGGGQAARPRLVERWLPVLTSVLIQAVKAIPALAMALEGRGLGRAGPRTTLVDLGPTRRFLLHLLAAAAVVALVAAPVACPALGRVFALPGL